MAVSIRHARPDDLAALGALAIRSKAHWGYDEAFMAACREELVMSDAALESEIVRLIDKQGEIAGFYRLELPNRHGEDAGMGSACEIEGFFVEPRFIGCGIGKALWRDLVEQARANGIGRITSQSDPNAVGFYERMGMRQTGLRPSGSIAGRDLPMLELMAGDAAA